ncbi:MAG: sodium/sugar symporter [Bacteroidota bacterium]
MEFATIDYVVFGAYALLILAIGLWVSREKDGGEKDAADYFLASKSLPWWAIGASLIASNISAEQFIGMSGSGFRMGLAIASYEWMAAVTLLLVAYFFLPIFLKKGIYTMPQFLQMRYDDRVRNVLAVFWLFVFVFVNLTSVLHLGALAMENIMGVNYWYALVGLAVFAAIYSIYGGLKAVAWTDVVQVIFLIGGGLLTTYMALQAYGDGAGVMAGFSKLMSTASDHFSMILDPGEIIYQDDTGTDKDAYMDLPGLSVLIGGMWIANVYYWGFNQYIIQRALAAKNIAEAQRGLAFAGYLKLLLPLIVVIPGIVAYAMYTEDPTAVPIGKADEAYPWLLGKFIGPGLKGLAFAALIAAVVSSLASMMNSTSTIFTMDLYRNYVDKDASQKKLVFVGRIAAFVALLLAVMVAYPLLGATDQVFQYIQEYTGFVSPGVLAIFITGLFYKKATSNAALLSAVVSIPLSVLMKVFFEELPFMNRMGIVFLVCLGIIALFSYLEKKGKDDPKGIDLSDITVARDPIFMASAFGILILTTVLYVVFW